MPLDSYTQTDELTERRRLETPLLLLVWMGCVGFSLGEGNLFYLVSSTLAVGVNWLAARRNKVVYVNRVFVNLGVITATLIIFAEHYLNRQSVLLTLSHYMILIQLCKLFEKKKSRDYVQLLALNLLLLMCTALITASPWSAFWMIAYFILACYVAMVFTLKRGLDLAASIKLHGESGPLSPRKVAWNVSRYWPGKSIRRIMLIIIIPSLMMGVIVFLLAPRIRETALGGHNQYLAEDFESNIKLGRSREIYLSDRIAMKLQIIRKGTPGPAQSQSSRYMRRDILDQYSDSTWSIRRQPQRTQILEPVDIEKKLKDKLVLHDITLLRISPGDLLAPNTTVNIESSKNNLPGESEKKINVSINGKYTLNGPFPPIQKIKYITESFPSPLKKEELAFLQQMGRYQKARAKPSLSINLPLNSQKKILKLAEKWCKDILAKRKAIPEERSKLNLGIAQRIAGKLRQDYYYTLDLTESDPNRDGVEDFLFHLKKGHCEYFASAMAVMCNLLEVPAHVATGFMLDEYDKKKKEYVVRNHDAHAWCEVYSPETGWIIIDPTSGTARGSTIKRPWWGFLSDVVDNIHLMWYEKIVGYGFQTQKELSKKTAIETKKLWLESRKNLTSLVQSLRKSLNNFIIHGEIDLILVDFLAGLVVLAILIFLLLLLRLKFQKKPLDQINMHKKLKLLYRFLTMLHRKGLPHHPELTLREKLFNAGTQFNLPKEPLEEMIGLQYRWRWGGKELTTEDIRMVRQSFVTLCEALDVSPSRSKQDLQNPNQV